jgi:hypothetical protein
VQLAQQTAHSFDLSSSRRIVQQPPTRVVMRDGSAIGWWELPNPAYVPTESYHDDERRRELWWWWWYLLLAMLIGSAITYCACRPRRYVDFY